jgi:hypothetical protein
MRLRRKIEADPARPELIKTERGLGYRFCAAVTTVYSAANQDIGRAGSGYKLAAPPIQGV